MVVSLYIVVVVLLAELELVVRLVVQVLQEGVQSQERWKWMRKIEVDHNMSTEPGPT